MAKCGKICFPSRAVALRVMRKMPGGRTGQVPMRAYRCGKCKAWHFTTGTRIVKPR